MQDVKLDDLHSDKSIKRAEQFTDLWTCPFVWTHTDFIQAERINSGLTSPNKLGRRPATDKRRLSVAQLGLLTSDHRLTCPDAITAVSWRTKRPLPCTPLEKGSWLMQSGATLSTPIRSLFYTAASPPRRAVWEIYIPTSPGWPWLRHPQ